MDRAGTVQAGDEDSGRRQLGARNQVRRLPHACPDRQRPWRAADTQRARLDGSKYPDVAAAIDALNCRQAYVDGELCAVLPDGTTSFSALQGHGDAPAALVYFAFDLLHLDGEDLMRLFERKARLKRLSSHPPTGSHRLLDRLCFHRPDIGDLGNNPLPAGRAEN
jgi:hypothetical protein